MPYDKERPVVWLATGNMHKYTEAKLTLSNYGIPLRQLKTRKLEIQSERPAEIARYAAEHLSKNRVVATEDSGLFVKALNGFPGPYSSYFERTVGIQGVLTLLGNRRNRAAYYYCAVAVAVPEDATIVFDGKANGRISYGIRGVNGFGYDPIFIPEGYDQTFGEAGTVTKNKISHRNRAFRNMARWYLKRWPRKH